ncbi:hypothetical protein AMTRI_Chr07g76320 [Amborella trichopoda]
MAQTLAEILFALRGRDVLFSHVNRESNSLAKVLQPSSLGPILFSFLPSLSFPISLSLLSYSWSYSFFTSSLIFLPHFLIISLLVLSPSSFPLFTFVSFSFLSLLL